MSRIAPVRLFVALDLPATLCEELRAWALSATRESALHGARLLDEETMHITISFLGSRPVAEIEPLCALVEHAARPLASCGIGAPLWLPRQRPRALAVEVHDDSETLAELHRDVARALAASGLGDVDAAHGGGRTFRPHLTVARLPRGCAPNRRELAPTPQRSFVPQRLTLYRSHLEPEGASYEALASFATLPLGAKS
jgi:RNA 2',3'-cyclic 3'-phosphodiesterase